nr:protein BIC1-like [Tanacetum cinerariifolium]
METHKNLNLDTIRNPRQRSRSHDTITTSSQDCKPTHEEFSSQKGEKGLSALSVINILQKKGDHIAKTSTTPQVDEKQLEARKRDVVEESGRERLKRHRVEMSGHVWIPETWGQEDLLKNWIDSTVFDSSLEKSNIMSARDALIQEGRSTTLRIENSC